MAKYTTIQGDHWDMIAKKVYGSELHAAFLMANNYLYLDVYEFDSGVEINCPDLPETRSENLPPWRS